MATPSWRSRVSDAIRDLIYPDLPRVQSSASIPASLGPGDNGGPIWSGSKAIGWMSSAPAGATYSFYSHVSSLEWQAQVVTQITP
jgi:hypothetical protein